MKFLDISLLSIVLVLSLFTAYMRIQSTLVGYKIGDLKDDESRYLDQVSGLRMELAKLTSKKNLTILASREAGNKDPFKALASIEKETKQRN